MNTRTFCQTISLTAFGLLALGLSSCAGNISFENWTVGNVRVTVNADKVTTYDIPAKGTVVVSNLPPGPFDPTWSYTATGDFIAKIEETLPKSAANGTPIYINYNAPFLVFSNGTSSSATITNLNVVLSGLSWGTNLLGTNALSPRSNISRIVGTGSDGGRTFSMRVISMGVTYTNMSVK